MHVPSCFPNPLLIKLNSHLLVRPSAWSSGFLICVMVLMKPSGFPNIVLCCSGNRACDYIKTYGRTVCIQRGWGEHSSKKRPSIETDVGRASRQCTCREKASSPICPALLHSSLHFSLLSFFAFFSFCHWKYWSHLSPSSTPGRHTRATFSRQMILRLPKQTLFFPVFFISFCFFTHFVFFP